MVITIQKPIEEILKYLKEQKIFLEIRDLKPSRTDAVRRVRSTILASGGEM